jgi:hypothetical protein
LDQCEWPALQAPYDNALRQAVAFILDHVSDVIAIVACGSILRGSPSASSDLDIYVLREKLERQRLQRWFNGVPAEIFINPPGQVQKYIDQERQDGRPITAHMLATGHVVLALADTLSELQALAKDALSAHPDPSAERLVTARYMAAIRFEDATDIWETRPEAARMILNIAIYDMLRYRFLEARQFLPRDKDLFVVLETLDPHLSDLAQRYFSESSPDRVIDIAHQIADHTIKTFGFFEWESAPEAVTIRDDQQ